jgi:hypothetical protein
VQKRRAIYTDGVGIGIDGGFVCTDKVGCSCELMVVTTWIVKIHPQINSCAWDNIDGTLAFGHGAQTFGQPCNKALYDTFT